jgi:hypothetical protein
MTADDYLYAAKREMVDRIIVGAGEERMRRRPSSSSGQAIEGDREGTIVEASSLSSMHVCVSEYLCSKSFPRSSTRTGSATSGITKDRYVHEFPDMAHDDFLVLDIGLFSCN